MGKYNKVLLTSLYVGIIGVVFMCILVVISSVKNFVIEKPKYDYTLRGVFMSDIMSVASTKNDSFVRPYVKENISIGKTFYDIKEDSSKQENSLIYYEGSYIQNNGVDYISDEVFDVVSVLDGEVISIDDNSIYGKTLTIKHNDNLLTTYSNISNVLVGVGYKVSQGEIIAASSESTINNKKQTLHFEVIYHGKKINPETIYTINVSSMQ